MSHKVNPSGQNPRVRAVFEVDPGVATDERRSSDAVTDEIRGMSPSIPDDVHGTAIDRANVAMAGHRGDG